MSTGNLLFFVLMLLGPMVSISSSSWLICWVGIELSFLGFIPVMISDNSHLSVSKESTMKYFCIQAMGSGLFLLGGLLLYTLPMGWNLGVEILFAFSIMIKLGIFPAHFWVPSVVSGLSWFSMFLLLTWQKVGPFFFISNLCENLSWAGETFLMLGGMSAVVGGLIGLNQTKVAPMLGASSISHGGWVLMGAVYGGMWTYFFIYCLSFSLLICFLYIEDSFMTSVGILCLTGLPPFVLFLGKWTILSYAMSSLHSSFWFVVLPLFGSITSLFFYLKFFYSFYLEDSSVSLFKLGAVSSVLFMSVAFGSMYIWFF